jgi:hypothetical protein
MVAYYYPPMAAAGSHRVMHFSRELKHLGWSVRVVSSRDFKRNRQDPGLLARLDEGIRVRRVPTTDVVELMARMVVNLRRGKAQATPARGATHPPGAAANGNGQARAGFFDYFSRFLKTPDSMLTFVPGAVLGAFPWMMSARPDVIFSSAPPYSCHLAALCLKHLFRVPWIADFRDPWTDNPFRKDNPYPSLHALNRSLEAMVVREADAVVTNTPALEDAFRRRYPNLDSFVTITNGFDPALLERVRHIATGKGEGEVSPIRMVHTGEVYGLRSPHALIEALGDLAREDPGLPASFEIAFYGNVEEKALLLKKARGLGVDGSFRFADPVEHAKALEICAGSDMLLLLGVKGDKPEVQVPSKLYEYLALGKPILSLSKRGGAIEGILEQSGVPYLLGDLEKVEEIKVLLRAAARGEFRGTGGWDGVHDFGFDRLARRLAGLFIRLKQGEAPNKV